MESLYRSKNLKNESPYGHPIYINNSFCKEFSKLNILVMKAKKEGGINRWKIKHGVNFIQMGENGDFYEISHINDLVKHGIVSE